MEATKMQSIRLEPGESICWDCDGHGDYRISFRTYICSTCKGRGKIDWIQRAMGPPSCVYVKPGVYSSIEVTKFKNGKVQKDLD